MAVRACKSADGPAAGLGLARLDWRAVRGRGDRGLRRDHGNGRSWARRGCVIGRGGSQVFKPSAAVGSVAAGYGKVGAGADAAAAEYDGTDHADGGASRR